MLNSHTRKERRSIDTGKESLLSSIILYFHCHWIYTSKLTTTTEYLLYMCTTGAHRLRPSTQSCWVPHQNGHGPVDNCSEGRSGGKIESFQLLRGERKDSRRHHPILWVICWERFQGVGSDFDLHPGTLSAARRDVSVAITLKGLYNSRYYTEVCKWLALQVFQMAYCN